MLIYYILFFILAFFAFLGNKNRKYLIIPFTIFVIFYIFKARVGTDYHTYKLYFYDIKGLSDLGIGGFEIGYNFFCLLFRTLCLPFQFMYIVMGTFVVVIFYKTTKKLKLEFGLALFLSLYFIFYPTLETLRQEIAIIIFYNSLTLLLKDTKDKREAIRNRNKYFIFNFIGLLFHRTAVMTFIYYFFRKQKTIKIGILAFFLFFEGFQPLILNVLSHFPLAYNRYYYYIWAQSVNGTKNAVISFKLIEYVIALIILLGWKDKKDIEEMTLNLIELGIIIQVFVTPLMQISYRLVYYCDIGMLLFYTNISKKIKIYQLKLLYIFVMIIYLGIRFTRIFPFNNDAFIYHFLY